MKVKLLLFEEKSDWVFRQFDGFGLGEGGDFHHKC